jgi:hypothetical protein
MFHFLAVRSLRIVYDRRTKSIGSAYNATACFPHFIVRSRPCPEVVAKFARILSLLHSLPNAVVTRRAIVFAYDMLRGASTFECRRIDIATCKTSAAGDQRLTCLSTFAFTNDQPESTPAHTHS